MAPAISPDGTRIAFRSGQDIYVMNIDGTERRRLTDTPAYESHPDWSPDGTQITFVTERDGNREIYTMHADGSNPQRLTNDPADDLRPDWSPDGTQILFNSERDGNFEIYVVGTDGSNLRRLTDDPKWEMFPRWSPDGTQIAYTYATPRRWDQEIYVMDVDGSNARQLTDLPAASENPIWSPDGSQIVFQSDRDGNFEIYVMDADGGNQRRLTNHPDGDYWPSWGPAAVPRGKARLSFEKSAQAFASVPTWKIGLADLDADGDLDAVFANAQQKSSQVWLNDGGVQGGTPGHFSDSGQRLTAQGHGIDVGDLDGDGDLDVLVTSHTANATEVYLNDGNARFERVDQAFDGSIGYRAVLADVDGDGDLDAVGEDGSETSVYLNDGTGHFVQSEISFPLTVILGDLDGDGNVDVFIKEEGVGYTAMLNDGAGSFSSHWAHEDATAMQMGDLALGDVDNDGDLDIVITNGHFQSTSHPALVFMNDGGVQGGTPGQFTDSGQRLSAVNNAGVALGDLDGDGDPDLVLTDYQKPNQVWVNDGMGSFSDSGIRFGDGQFYRHAHLGDLDGDGDLDVFLATFGIGEGPNEIWFNQQH
jgi:TolB protein